MLSKAIKTYLMISSYSLSAPLDSFHRRYITEASTLAGEKVFGSFKREITLNNIVLKRLPRNVKHAIYSWEYLIAYIIKHFYRSNKAVAAMHTHVNFKTKITLYIIIFSVEFNCDPRYDIHVSHDS